MDVKEILRHVDHTLLAPTATWEEIRQICDDGIKYGCASVCIPQTYVAHAGGSDPSVFLSNGYIPEVSAALAVQFPQTHIPA